MACGNHNARIRQFSDYVGRHHFRRECNFGDDVGIIAQEIDQRSVWFTHEIRIMGAFFTRLSQGPSRWRPSAWCGCFSRYSRMTRMPCFINSSLVVISVGRKLVQPDFSLAFCIISSVSTLTASAVSLNCTPPQPFNCTSIKPGREWPHSMSVVLFPAAVRPSDKRGQSGH